MLTAGWREPVSVLGCRVNRVRLPRHAYAMPLAGHVFVRETAAFEDR